jgi:hypothetical protein
VSLGEKMDDGAVVGTPKEVLVHCGRHAVGQGAS